MGHATCRKNISCTSLDLRSVTPPKENKTAQNQSLIIYSWKMLEDYFPFLMPYVQVLFYFQGGVYSFLGSRISSPLGMEWSEVP